MPEILEILNIPRTVAIVHQPEDLDFLSRTGVSVACDLLEFRLDSLRDHLDAVEKNIAAAEVPCIITARHPAEGGDGDLDGSERAALLERFLPHATLVDVEISSLEEMGSVIDSAKHTRVALIASFHHFEKSPPLAELEDVIGKGTAAGADVTKVAVAPESMLSLFELVQWQMDRVNLWQRLSLMGMGPLGKLSRLVFASAGSCLNYGYLREANAPGQWPAAELKRIIAELRANENGERPD